MRTATCLQPKVHYLAAFGFAALTLALLVGSVRSSQAQESGGVVPASHQSGSFFNKKLGTALRFNYHTQGYGTQDDVFSLGGMKVFNMDDATVFVDGQGTLSEDFGGGFNLGVGYRQLTTTGMSFDPERILGLGFWTDGQSTSSDNFFTQLGFSLESLGDSYDLRLNGHFPLERTQTSDAVLTGTGTPFFIGNNIFGATEEFTIDTAHSVVDGEFAKRINNLEAWAFVGGYQLGGGGVDATGYRAGVRGYAIPDVALSLQVTDDEVYATNVMFGVTWFIGRTNKCNGPCGTLLDRFREPVQRNDFIATTSRRGSRASGNALTDAATNDAIRIVHIDGNNTGTGDGTIENPYGTFTEAATHVDNDILLVHSGSTLTDTIVLKEGVRLLGEGRDPNISPGVVAVVHQVDTNELNLINLPEAVSLTGVTPTINAVALAETFVMGDGSTVNNFIVNGGTSAVVANGIAAPTGSMLANLDLNNQTGDAVSLNNVTGSLIIDNSVLIEGAGGSAVFVNGGFEGMTINAGIVNAAGGSLTVQGRTGGIFTYGGTIDDDGGTGILVSNNTDSTINLSNASTEVTNGIDIDASNGGDAIAIDGNTNSTITFSGTVGAMATGGGTDDAISITNNTNSTVDFTGVAGVTATGMNQGVLIDGNDVDTNITFTDLDATALAGDTVSIDDGGTVNISSADATRMIANRGDGNAVVIDGDAVADNNATITISSAIENRLAGGGAVLGRSVLVQNRTANDVNISGTVNDEGLGLLVNANTGGQTIFSGAVTTDTGNNNGVTVTNTNTNALTNFGGGLDITTTGGTAFSATGAGTLAVSGTNTITTTTGVGLDIDGTTIGGAGASFSSVDVNGATNGVVLSDLTGGQVRVGGATATGTDGAGGTLTTTGTAILVSGVTNAVFNDVSTSTGGASDGVSIEHTTAADSSVLFNNLTHTSTGTGNGVVVTDNGTGELDFTLRNSTVDITTADSLGFNLITGANAGEIDVRLDNNVILAGDNSAVAVDLSAGTGDVQFLVNGGNDWSNNSATAATASFLVSTDRTLNATIGDQTGIAPFDENRFANANAGGTAFDMEVNSGAAIISLDLQDNNASGNVDYVLTQTAGTFGVVDLTGTVTNDANNAGLVDIDGGNVIGDFIDLVGPIKQVD